ncbi:hypothetical protein PAXINDRAFT_85585, partial [Paxillus involutus ATCC 200175]
IPPNFLIAICTLTDFCYLAQATSFTDKSIRKVAGVLQEFHDHKEAILHAEAQTGKNGPILSWNIPKLELLQSVVPSIQKSGVVMQWTADITERTHVEEIKIPARSGNNQNYYSQISRHLDCLEKCFCFDLATYIESRPDVMDLGDDNEAFEQDNKHDRDPNNLSLFKYHSPTRVIVNYAISEAKHPKALKPHRIFSTATTGFRVTNKPSL